MHFGQRSRLTAPWNVMEWLYLVTVVLIFKRVNCCFIYLLLLLLLLLLLVVLLLLGLHMVLVMSRVQFCSVCLSECINVECAQPRRVPAEWKEGIIVSLYKGKGSQTECSSYRPISLLSVSGKVFAHILLARFQPLLDKCHRPQQSGFIAGRMPCYGCHISLEIAGRVTPKF